MDNTVENKKTYLCDNCGGGMKFDINKQKLICEYCGTEEENIDTTKEILEHDLSQHIELGNASDWTSEVKVIKCESCGAEMIINGEETSAQCSFCGSNHITDAHEKAGIKPEAILPFKIDSHEAMKKLEKWIKTQYCSPKGLRDVYKNGKLKPIYVPYWTFDADTDSSYSGKGGKVYYETETKDGKEVRVKKVKWYPTSGKVNRFFDDIQVNASKNFNERMINSIEPFNMSALVPYDKKYLAGYIAERYTKSLEECFEIAKSEMNSEIRKNAKADILRSYGEAKIDNIDINYNNRKFKHILIPIWTATYEYKGKKYQYLINGETGKINGTVPYSVIKVLLVLAGIAAIIIMLVNSGVI